MLKVVQAFYSSSRTVIAELLFAQFRYLNYRSDCQRTPPVVIDAFFYLCSCSFSIHPKKIHDHPTYGPTATYALIFLLAADHVLPRLVLNSAYTGRYEECRRRRREKPPMTIDKLRLAMEKGTWCLVHVTYCKSAKVP